MTRLLQPDPKTSESNGLSRWLSGRLDARQVAREVAAEIELTQEQVDAEDSLFGCLPEEKP